MSIRFRDLVTVDEVVGDSLSQSDLLDSPDGDEYLAVERMVGWATDRIERYLQRNLIVQRYSKFRPDWEVFDKRDPDLDDNEYVAEARQWPVVEVETSDPTVQIHAEGDRILSDDVPEIVDLFAGYIRSDQKLSDAQNELSTDLTTTPDTLPYDIRQVASNLVRHRLTVTENRLDGIQEKTAQVRQETITVRSPDRNYVGDQLRTLYTYRHLSP